MKQLHLPTLASLLPASLMAAALTLSGCGGAAGNFSSPSPTSPTPAAVTVAISGPQQTRLGGTSQFSAVVANSANQAVTWQVNGVTGGGALSGTISAAGLYTPPASLPGGNSVNIGVIAQASANATASTAEAIWNPVPVLGSAAAFQTGTSANYLVDVQGSNFVNGAQIQIGGASVITSYISATELQATVTPAAGTSTVAVDVLNPAPGSVASATSNVSTMVVKASVAAASRLLDQATFGPTLTDIQHVQTVGLGAYLTEQFTTTQTVLPDISNPPPAQCTTTNKPCLESEWWQTAMTGPDQLRQRVAFALSEIFVVSTNSNNPNSIIPYQNILAKDAFGNFQTLMKDVSLSTAMGAYLNMLNSAKPAAGQIANENYPRELMQLFTIGLNQLNQDGTPKLDTGGNPIPTYTETQVQAFARAYTGWTYASLTGTPNTKFPNNTANFDNPMTQVEAYHDTTAKTLLNGTTLPAGQTAAQDLTGAIANIFANDNVGPFVCKQLIQHLVSSNPSPAYVSRVAAIFANDGSGTRGNLRAVIRAILLDTEARAGDTDPTQDGGHLREPMLYLTDVMRALGYVNTDPTGYWGSMGNYSGPLGQRPYESPSVFNFFPPDYVIPGTTTNAPEFGQENTASSILRLTLANSLVYGNISGFKVDLSATSALGMMAANPANLVDSLGTLFMHGQMPATMRTAIINHISTLTDPAQRVRVATYLVITSSQYKILH